MNHKLVFWALTVFIVLWWAIWLKRILHRHWWSIREARRYQHRCERRSQATYVMSQVKSPPRLDHLVTLNRCDDPPLCHIPAGAAAIRLAREVSDPLSKEK